MIKKTAVILCLLMIICTLLPACKEQPEQTAEPIPQSTAADLTSEETDPVTTEKPAEEPVIDGINAYNTENNTMYVTWLNVWFGSTESWHGNVPSTDSARLQSTSYIMTKFGTTMRLMDANKASMREVVFNNAKEAGINALVMDLTNGYTGWGQACLHYQMMCYDNYMYFTVATHPKTAGDLEDICRGIYTSYVTNYWGDCFLYKNGKPMMVLYCTPEEWKNSSGGKLGEFASKFTFMWASGENAKSDKWGWQLDPTKGPIPSSDSMFLTSSVVWNSPSINDDAWRKSLAMLDFCFLAQRQSQPAYSVIGSLDDPCERNNWNIADTSSDKVINGLKMKDIFGNISIDAYYNRVKDWINGGAEAFVPGGIIPDGAYTVSGVESGDMFGVRRPSEGKANDIKSDFIRNKYLNSNMEKYYFFYHVGNDYYRIIKLTSGLSLTADGDGLIQDWDEADDSQFWLLTRSKDGTFTFTNKKTGKKLCDGASSGDKITLTENGSMWNIVPVADRQIVK